MVAVTLLITLALGAPVNAAPAEEAQSNLSRQVCELCHSAQSKAHDRSAHGVAIRRANEDDDAMVCNACHQVEADHLRDPVSSSIATTADLVMCGGCHATQHQVGVGARHEEAGVTCAGCHDAGHQSAQEDANRERNSSFLLNDPAVQTCGDCHGDQVALSKLPFAHRSGMVAAPCTDCHLIHELPDATRSLHGSDVGSCGNCHETGGPFVYPHPPGDEEACALCHVSHGSANPKLLTRRSTLSLCIECHAGIPAFHDVASDRYRRCTTCHVAIHGSNTSPALLDE